MAPFYVTGYIWLLSTAKVAHFTECKLGGWCLKNLRHVMILKYKYGKDPCHIVVCRKLFNDEIVTVDYLIIYCWCSPSILGYLGYRCHKHWNTNYWNYRLTCLKIGLYYSCFCIYAISHQLYCISNTLMMIAFSITWLIFTDSLIFRLSVISWCGREWVLLYWYIYS